MFPVWLFLSPRQPVNKFQANSIAYGLRPIYTYPQSKHGSRRRSSPYSGLWQLIRRLPIGRNEPWPHEYDTRLPLHLAPHVCRPLLRRCWGSSWGQQRSLPHKRLAQWHHLYGCLPIDQPINDGVWWIYCFKSANAEMLALCMLFEVCNETKPRWFPHQSFLRCFPKCWSIAC
jgi:hypothetical protein